MLLYVLALENFNKAFSFLPSRFPKKGPEASFTEGVHPSVEFDGSHHRNAAKRAHTQEQRAHRQKKLLS
jgi:hypothetical protein